VEGVGLYFYFILYLVVSISIRSPTTTRGGLTTAPCVIPARAYRINNIEFFFSKFILFVEIKEEAFRQ
jgi:hypothetical protein